MALKIVENIKRVRDALEAGTFELSGDDLAELGKEAIFQGINSEAWKELMRVFVPENSKEFIRLIGEDDWFMDQKPWGPLCLVYIAGDSNCTAPTYKKGGTMRTMEMIPERDLPTFVDAEESDFEDNPPE